MTLDLDALRGHTLTQLGSVMCGAALGNDKGKAVAVSEELARREAAVAELVAALESFDAAIDFALEDRVDGIVRHAGLAGLRTSRDQAKAALEAFRKIGK